MPNGSTSALKIRLHTAYATQTRALWRLFRRYSKLPLLGISNRLARSEHRSERTALVPRRVTRRLSRKAIARLPADYQAGGSTREPAKTFGISRRSVPRLLQEHGVTLRHQGLSPTQATEATDLNRAGRSVAQVASKLGLSLSSVYDALTRSGVEMRAAHEPGRA
jgi:hypothetical protein